MNGSQSPAAAQPDFEVQVVTLEHAISAALRGTIQVILGGLCFAYGWDFVIWAAQDFPNAAAVLLGPNAGSMLVKAFFAWIGTALLIGGKTKLLFVSLVYVIDAWMTAGAVPMKRRGATDPYE